MKILLLGGQYDGEEMIADLQGNYLKLPPKGHFGDGETFNVQVYRKLDLRFRRNYFRDDRKGYSRFEEIEDLYMFADSSISDETAKTLTKVIIRALNAEWKVHYN